MILKNIPFEKGSLKTMVDRLYKTMNAIDQGWSKEVEAASQSQKSRLQKILWHNIAEVFRLYLQTMGKHDNGLLEQEWDGKMEVNIDAVLKNYMKYYNFFDDFSASEFLPFSIHWTDAILLLK